MSRRASKPASFSALMGILSLLLITVFATEVAIMDLLAELYPREDSIAKSVLDAVTLALAFSLPLWFFVLRPATSSRVRRALDVALPRYPVALYLVALTGIFCIQFLVMQFFLPRFGGYWPPEQEPLVDATVSLVLSAPILLWLLYRLGLHRLREPLVDFLHTPVTLFVLLLFMILMADLMQEIIAPVMVPGAVGIGYKALDSGVSTVIIAPLLWLLVVRPLIRLASSEQARIRAIYDQVIDAILLVNEQGRVQSLNLAAQTIFGYGAQEVQGQSAEMFFEGEQHNLAGMLRGAAENGGDSNAVRVHELVGRRRDGSNLIMDVSISWILTDGRHEFLLILRDITDNKKAAEALRESHLRFQQIFNQTEDAIMFFVPGTGTILEINTIAETLFGYSKTELHILGMEHLSRPDGADRLLRVIKGPGPGEIALAEELVCRCKQGQEINVSVHSKLMTLQGREVTYCTFRDISERIRVEREALEIQSKLIQANKMTSLGLLVSGVSHEINNPNNFVLANAQMLDRSWADVLRILRGYYQENGDFSLGGIPFSELEAQSAEMFAGIIDGSRRISEIVNNLKKFARQEGPVAERHVDVNQVVHAAVSILRHELARHTENFHLELAESLPRLRGNAQQLGQVVINLLMNACQALPDKAAGIWLTTAVDPATDRVTITVKDQGLGITVDQGSQIMTPFFTTKQDSGGTGLGLSISQTIIKEHQGTLEFTSETGIGTCFTVSLPAESSDMQEGDA